MQDPWCLHSSTSTSTLALPSDALKICYLLSLLSPKENSSAVVSHLVTAYSHIPRPIALQHDLLLLTPLSCSQILISLGDFKMVEHYPKAICKPDRTNMPTNFNLELLDKQCSPLISTMMPKLKSRGTPEIPWSIL